MFDRHWWLKRDASEVELRRTRILEPKVKSRRKKNKTSMRIPSGFEFADLNHRASRRPREFPGSLPPQLPSSGNPTPSIPASQPLMQDRAQRHFEVLLQPQTTQTQSTANTTTAPPASAAQPSNTVSSTMPRTNLRPLEPRPIQSIQRPIFQATQLAPFHHQAVPI
jgi:hypothetical protein